MTKVLTRLPYKRSGKALALLSSPELKRENVKRVSNKIHVVKGQRHYLCYITNTQRLNLRKARGGGPGVRSNIVAKHKDILKTVIAYPDNNPGAGELRDNLIAVYDDTSTDDFDSRRKTMIDKADVMLLNVDKHMETEAYNAIDGFQKSVHKAKTPEQLHNHVNVVLTKLNNYALNREPLRVGAEPRVLLSRIVQAYNSTEGAPLNFRRRVLVDKVDNVLGRTDKRKQKKSYDTLTKFQEKIVNSDSIKQMEEHVDDLHLTLNSSAQRVAKERARNEKLAAKTRLSPSEVYSELMNVVQINKTKPWNTRVKNLSAASEALIRQTRKYSDTYNILEYFLSEADKKSSENDFDALEEEVLDGLLMFKELSIGKQSNVDVVQKRWDEISNKRSTRGQSTLERASKRKRVTQNDLTDRVFKQGKNEVVIFKADSKNMYEIRALIKDASDETCKGRIGSGFAEESLENADNIVVTLPENAKGLHNAGGFSTLQTMREPSTEPGRKSYTHIDLLCSHMKMGQLLLNSIELFASAALGHAYTDLHAVPDAAVLDFYKRNGYLETDYPCAAVVVETRKEVGEGLLRFRKCLK